MAQSNQGNRKRKSHKFLSRMKKRLLVVIVIALAAFVVLVGRILKINMTQGKEYEQKVLAQQGYSSVVIPYKRGDIVDSNGTILATSKKVYNIILEPKNILEKDKYYTATTNALKQYFGFTDSELADALSDPNSYYKVTKKKQDYELVKEFQEFCKTDEGSDVRGVYFEEEYLRVYPNGNLACHLLGYTVSGNVGQYGIEQYYNEELNGSNGREYTYLNEDYGLTDTIEPPVNGYTLVTSIDANIQKIIQEKVDAYMETEGAKNVSVIVMDPNTCNILALYNSHSFDPNDAQNLEAVRYQFDDIDPDSPYTSFEDFEQNCTDEDRVNALNEVWRNFVVSDVFEPGSTYKTFTISGALEEGVIQPSDTFYCDGGEQKDIFYIKCHAYKNGGHGMVDVAGALANSCNDALMQISAREGSDKFDKYQVLFGFGQRTNVDLPGEPSNSGLSTIVYHADNLHVTELATSSFGQGVCTSMMQIGTAFCSVINGGYYYQPSVVQRIEDENGNIIDNLDNVLVRRTVSEETSAIMREELFGVVENGTGKRASVEGYSIGGKTGTAEKLPRGNGKYIISFIGFAPVDNPQVVVYVVVDEPNVEDQGSSAASSFIFADIATELFPYMNIYKNNDNYDLDLIDAEDEPTDSIYEGDVPENDVAGGNDNPYVGDVTTETSEEQGTNDTGETTESIETTETTDEVVPETGQ